MREFFHGWRRKLGCVTLVMGLVLMVGWIRSRVVQEGLSLRYSEQLFYSVASRDGTLDLGRRIDAEQLPDLPIIQWMTLPHPDNSPFVTPLPARKWRWQATGFGVSHLDLPEQHFTIWTVPYWFPTGLLTIVSTWLLLSKSRPRPQPTPAAPDHA